MSKVYFPNLNGLRFFAALAVIIHHTEQFKSIFGIENYWKLSFIKIIGNLGVTLFFVLSGFLISYIILSEKKKNGNINYKNFFMRRALRIWPLYFLIIFLSFFCFPYFEVLNFKLSANLNEDFYLKLILFILFLPNFVLRIFPTTPFASQTWSIGVEEQFYILWPLIISYTKNILRLFILLIILFPIIKFILYYISIKTGSDDAWFYTSKIFSDLSISSLALGSLSAYLVLEKKTRILNLIYNKWVLRTYSAFLFILLIYGEELPYLHYEIYSVLFTIIIVNLATNSRTIKISFENKVLNYLGKISYGIYMFHPFCIVLSINLMSSLEVHNTIYLYLLVLLLTILISGCSYHFFELRFLNLKNKYGST